MLLQNSILYLSYCFLHDKYILLVSVLMDKHFELLKLELPGDNFDPMKILILDIL